MKSFLVAAAFCALASTASAQTVGGKYTVAGTNFDGSPYKGTASITVSSKTTCRIAWQTGGTSSQGFCMLQDGALAAAYKLGSNVGLIIYKLQSDGVLEGIWTLADKDGAGTEVLTPAR